MTLSLVLLAAAAATGTPQVQPGAYASAVEDCRASFADHAVDEAKLASLGWRPGSITEDGKSVDTPLRFLGKTGAPMLILNSQSKNASCTFMGRVAKGGFDDVAQAVRASFKPDREIGRANANGALMMIKAQDAVMIAPSKDGGPAVTVVAIRTQTEKK